MVVGGRDIGGGGSVVVVAVLSEVLDGEPLLDCGGAPPVAFEPGPGSYNCQYRKVTSIGDQRIETYSECGLLTTFGSICRALILLSKRDTLIYKLSLLVVAWTWLAQLLAAETCWLAFVTL